jgi:hypothetical protein
MFEHVVLRRAKDGTPITAGQVAEALLFYQKVHLVIDIGTLRQLIMQIGPAQLLALTQRPDLTAVYTEEVLATITNDVGALQVHRLTATFMSGTDPERPLETRHERVQDQLVRAGVDTATAKRFTSAFLKSVPVRKLSGDHFIKGGIPDAATSDLLTPEFTLSAIRAALAMTPGAEDPGPAIRFDVIHSDLGLYVFENIDLLTINARRAAMSPPQEALSIAHLLGNILEARADLAMAAHYGGDFVTSAATSAIIRIRYAELLHRTLENADALRQFVTIVLPDAPTLAEVIDAGERSFSEFLRLLDRSDRFKRWVKSANPDEGLVREYMRAVTSEDWLQTTKSKGVRYLLTTAIDAVNPLAGIGAALADNFIVEKLLGGWRPNHFVNTRLAPFVEIPPSST